MAKKKNKKTEYYDLTFTFKYVCVNFQVDPDVYSKKDIKEIQKILQVLTKEITIDKSYVDFNLNKHDNVFLTLNGWNELCKLVIDTRKKASKKQNDTKYEAYIMMILSYLYLAFEQYGYDTEALYFEIEEDSYFMSEYQKDETEAWKTYPGKWQTWKWFKK